MTLLGLLSEWTKQAEHAYSSDYKGNLFEHFFQGSQGALRVSQWESGTVSYRQSRSKLASLNAEWYCQGVDVILDNTELMRWLLKA